MMNRRRFLSTAALAPVAALVPASAAPAEGRWVTLDSNDFVLNRRLVHEWVDENPSLRWIRAFEVADDRSVLKVERFSDQTYDGMSLRSTTTEIVDVSHLGLRWPASLTVEPTCVLCHREHDPASHDPHHA